MRRPLPGLCAFLTHALAFTSCSVFYLILLLLTVQIYTFDLVGYLQPAVRLGTWRVLISALSFLINVAIPSLLGLALFSGSGTHLTATSTRSMQLMRVLNMRNFVFASSGVIAFQTVVWVLLEVLPLRTTVSVWHEFVDAYVGGCKM